jgi:hypothetical protein
METSIQEVADNVYQFKVPIAFKLRDINLYLLMCAKNHRDGQKHSLQGRHGPISGGSHASRRAPRRWPSIRDAVCHRCVAARMPSKRRTISSNPRTPPSRTCRQALGPWGGTRCDTL